MRSPIIYSRIQIPEGPEILVSHQPEAKIIAVQARVGVGSMNETHEERGISHLIEHMLFKGTMRRGVGEFAKTVEACGGDTNAYTTFDCTVYYLTMAARHGLLGVDLLADVVINSTFDADELLKEKEVVVEEIRRSLDSPSQIFGQELFSRAYLSTVIARPIIGDEDSVRGFERADLCRYHQKWYQPSNIKFVIVGPLTAQDVVSEINKVILEKKTADKTWFIPFKNASLVSGETIKSLPAKEFKLLKSKFKQARLEIAFKGPSLEDADTAALDLAAFILGSGESSRLVRVLRDEKGLASAVSCSLYSPEFEGLFTMSAYPILADYKNCLKEMLTQLFELKNIIQKISEEELSRAIANFRIDKLYQDETVSGQARSLVQGMATTYKQYFDSVYLQQVAELTPDKIHATLLRWIDPEKVLILGMVPEESSVTESDLKDAFNEVVNSFSSKDKIKSTSVAKQAIELVAPASSGWTYAHHRVDESPFFNLVAVCRGGLSYETRESAGLFHAMGQLAFRASKKFSYDEVLEMTEGVGASIEGFSGKDSFGVKIHCLNEHKEQILELFQDLLLDMKTPDFLWDTHLRETLEAIKREPDSSSSMCLREFQKLMYNSAHPYCFPVYGFKDSVSSFSASQIEKAFAKHRDEAHWVVATVNSEIPERTSKLVSKIFSGFKVKKVALASSAGGIARPTVFNSHQTVDREQVHIALGYPGFTWQSKERLEIDVLSSLLGGQGGRLFLRLRDDESLAYSVSPYASIGIEQGYFAGYIASASDKYAQAKSGLKREFKLLKDEPIGSAELDRAKNYVIGGHEQDIQRSDSRAISMALMELYNLGFDDFIKFPDLVAQVSADDLAKLALKLFDEKSEVCSSVGRALSNS